MPFYKKDIRDEEGSVLETVAIELDNPIHIVGAVQDGFEKVTKAEFEKIQKAKEAK